MTEWFRQWPAKPSTPVRSDAFVLTALLLATSLFFAGVTWSFRVTTARLLLLMGAVVTMAIAAGRLVDLPIL